jgi:tRNA A37 methylthiotransferase MiaB
MSYTILKSNGEQLTQIVDGQIDQTTTDLTLIGKNASSYGTYYNENLVRLLENFSNTESPSNPITGQLWFDLSV